jgi:hypothetical protein
MDEPYPIKRRGSETLTLLCVTIINPATRWFEMKEEKKEDFTIATAVKQTWLNHYLWPTEIIFDRGSEFIGDFATMVYNDWGLTRSGTVVQNPQANEILEQIHQPIGNFI